MRLPVLADLHLEFGPVNIPTPEADAVVLAGGIDFGSKGLEWAGSRLGIPRLMENSPGMGAAADL